MSNDLDLEYTPSYWNKRFKSGPEVLDYHLKLTKELSHSVRSKIPYETVSYGTRSSETIDIFGTDLPADAPIFVFVHGGYWQILSKIESAFQVEPLYNVKCKVFIVDYSLCPSLTLEECVLQIVKCFQFVFDYATKASSRHIDFAGHSAGAHLILCAMNALLSSTQLSTNHFSIIKNFYLISGVYDLNDLRHTTVNTENVLSLTDDNVNQLSPLKFNYSSWQQLLNAKMYAYVAEYDSKTFIEQSKQLHQILQEKYQLNSEYILINGCDHFDIVENMSDNSFQMTKEIMKNISHFI